jgi:hypothetical protein
MSPLARDLFQMGEDATRQANLASAYQGVEVGLTEGEVDQYACQFGPVKIHPPDFLYREALTKAQRKIGFHAPNIIQGEF